MSFDEAALARARERVAGAERILVLSGAGLSAESGLDTFRGAGGLWRNHRATDLATPEAFARDPDLVWAFYEARRAAAFDVEPNPGHHALALLEERLGDGLLHLTQNVDGLIAAAGARRALEIHGSLRQVRCSRGCSEPFEDLRRPFPHPAVCDGCGSLLRPAVVWFGEGLDPDHLDRGFAFGARAEVVLVVGTSGQVEPAASLAREAARHGAALIDVNPEPSLLASHATEVLTGPAGAVLPRLIAT